MTFLMTLIILAPVVRIYCVGERGPGQNQEYQSKRLLQWSKREMMGA